MHGSRIATQVHTFPRNVKGMMNITLQLHFYISLLLLKSHRYGNQRTKPGTHPHSSSPGHVAGTYVHEITAAGCGGECRQS